MTGSLPWVPCGDFTTENPVAPDYGNSITRINIHHVRTGENRIRRHEETGTAPAPAPGSDTDDDQLKQGLDRGRHGCAPYNSSNRAPRSDSTPAAVTPAPPVPSAPDRPT